MAAVMTIPSPVHAEEIYTEEAAAVQEAVPAVQEAPPTVEEAAPAVEEAASAAEEPADPAPEAPAPEEDAGISRDEEPAQESAETAEKDDSVEPAADQPTETEQAQTEAQEELSDEDEEPQQNPQEEVRTVVSFVCDPSDTVLKVFSLEALEEEIEPQTDGTWLLVPGEYAYTAAAEGYRTKEEQTFLVSEEEESMEIRVTLEKEEENKPAFLQKKIVNGIEVTVKAPEGVFPEEAVLSVTGVPVSTMAAVDAAVEEKRPDDKNVAVSYTFDIKVVDRNGQEIEPAPDQKVEVSFRLAAVRDDNLETDVYHVTEDDSTGALTAEKLDVREQGDLAKTETEGFSLYTIEFTYSTLSYEVHGNGEEIEPVKLTEILDKVGLQGEIADAYPKTKRDPIYADLDDSDEWYVYVEEPFDTELILCVELENGSDDPVTYEITITYKEDQEEQEPVTYIGPDGKQKTIDKYSLIKDGFDASEGLKAGDYVVKESCTVTGDFFVDAGTVNIILCGGAVLTTDPIEIGSRATVNIFRDSSGEGSIVWHDTRSDQDEPGDDLIVNKGTLNLYGGTITGDADSLVKNRGVFNMNGGSLTGSGRYAAVNTGTFTMNGGSIRGSQTGAVYITAGTFTMNGGSIVNGAAAGILVPQGTVTINNGDIRYNNIGINSIRGSVTINGGQIEENLINGIKQISGDAALTITGGKVTKTGQDGTRTSAVSTAIDIMDGDFTMTGGSVTGNGNAGIAVHGEGTFSMSGAPVIKDNGSSGVYLYDGNIITLTGAFQEGAVIDVTSDDRDIITSGYQKYNETKDPNRFFRCTDDRRLINRELKNGEVEIVSSLAVPYLDAKGDEQYIEDYKTFGATEDTKEQVGWTLRDGWYVVKSSQTFNNYRLTTSGNVRLILCDDATLVLKYGIRIYSGSLTIYGQKGGSGTLVCNAPDGAHAAIGGNENESGGSLIVNSGNVKAYGAKYGAGIGGGINRGNNLITINGGYVFAKGGDYGAGIGASEGGTAGPVAINGGKVDAYGGLKAAGIGGGQKWHGGGDGGTVIIYGGEVYAEGSDYGAGIGGGEDGNGGQVYIYGGKVTAKAGEDASGIGGGDNGSGGSVNIYGGTVVAESTTGDSCAIGNGDDGNSKGTLKIGEDQKVSSERLFYEHEREGACQYRYKVRIEPCEHPAAATFKDVTDSTHLRTPCPYCGHHYKAEPHTYDLEHNKCTLCNYQGQLFTIRFEPNGGGGTMTTVEVVPEEIYMLPDSDFTAPKGYSFRGWVINEESSGSQGGDPLHGLYPAKNEIIVNHNLVLMAAWAKKTTLSFDANGGSGSMDPVERFDGEEYILPGNGFVPADRTAFKGWKIEGREFAPGKPYYFTDHNATAVAQWTEDLTGWHTIAVNMNNDDYGTVKAEQWGKENKDIQLVVTPKDGRYTLCSLTVTYKDGEETKTIQPSQDRYNKNQYYFSMPAQNVTVNAVFGELYPLYVDGVQVNSVNAADILGDGNVSYDRAAKTLTFTGNPVFTGNEYLILTEEGLTITAPEGGLSLSSDKADFGIYGKSDEAIIINGDVNIHTKEGAVFNRGDITINGSLTGTGSTSLVVSVFKSVNITGDADLQGGRCLIHANEGITIGESLNGTCMGDYGIGLYSAKDVTIGKDVTLTAKENGIIAKSDIRMVSGAWHITTPEGRTAISAARSFEIPETHGIRLPVDGVLNNGHIYVNGTDACEVIIEKKRTPEVTAPAAIDDLKYEAEDQVLVTAGSTTGGTLQYALTESGAEAPADENAWSTELPSAKNAGYYTVWYRVKGNGTYTDTAPGSVACWIRRVPLLIYPKYYYITYGEMPVYHEPLYEGFRGGENIEDLEGTLVLDFGYERYDDVGRYPIKASGLSSDNYIIFYETAGVGLIVSPRTVPVTWSDENEFVYNGKPQAPSAEVTDLLNGDDVSVVVSGKQTDAGENYIASASGLSGEKAGNYKLSRENAETSFSIRPREAVVKTEGAVKPYDGTPLTNASASITGLAEGDLVTATGSGSQTEVGWSWNTAGISWGQVNPGNYVLRQTAGKLEVTRSSQEITLTAASSEKTYDGKPLTDSRVIADGLPAGFTVVASASGSQTNAGSGVNKVNAGYVIKNAAGTDVTDCFTNIKTVEGTLKVDPAEITITAVDEIGPDAPYESTFEYYITGGFVEADKESLQIRLSLGQAVSEGTNPKTYPILVSFKPNSNYTISTVNGKYTVIDNISVTATGYNGVYDGKEHSISVEVKNGEAVVYYSDTEIADPYELYHGGVDNLTNPSYKEAGTYTVYYAVMGGGAFVSGSKTVVITPKELEIKAESKARTYGNADPELTYTADGLIGSDSLTGALSRDPGEDVGTYEIGQGTLDAGSNYTIRYTGALFAIGQRTLTVKADEKTKRYGDADPELTYTASGLAGSDRLTGVLSRDPGEKAGTYRITLGSLNAGYNYAIKYTGASLNITSASLQASSANVEGVYDGHPYRITVQTGNPDATVYYAEKELTESNYKTAGSTENPGFVDAGEYTVFYYVAAENYLPASGSNTITVKKAELNTDGLSAEQRPSAVNPVYNGRKQALVKDPEVLPEGWKVQYSMNGGRTWTYQSPNGSAAGAYGLMVRYEGDKNHETSSYFGMTASVRKADQETEAPAPVEGLIYDGTEQALVTAGSAEGGTLLYSLSEDGVFADSIPTGTDAGEYSVFYKAAGTYNYSESKTGGPVKVTIDRKAVTVTARDKKKTYGDTDPALTASVTGLLHEEFIDYTLNREPGENTGSYVIRPSGKAKQGNYSVTFVPGTLTIGKKTQDITAADVNAPYNGKPHGIFVDTGDSDCVTYYSSSELTGENYKTAGSIEQPSCIEAGDYTVYFYVESRNYDPDPAAGYRTVHISKTAGEASDAQKPVVVEGLTYDGTEKKLLTAPASLPEGYTGVQYSTDGGRTWTDQIPTGKDAGSTTINIRYTGDKNHNDFEAGSLVNYINKAVITITANDGIGPDDPDVSAIGYYTSEGLVETDEESLEISLGLGEAETGEDGIRRYPVLVSFKPNSNYRISAVNGTYTVIDDVSIAASDYIGVYDGKEHSISVEVKNGEAAVYYSDTEIADAYELYQKIEEVGGVDNLTNPSYKNAGTYTVYYAVTGGGEFVSGSKQVIIRPKDLAVIAEAKTKTYGDKDPELTYRADGLTEGDSLTGEMNRSSGEDVGTYPINAGTLSAGDNYKISFTPADLTINKASGTLSDAQKPAVVEGLIYDGTEKNLLTPPGSLPEGYTGVQYSTDGGRTWKDTIPRGKDAGSTDVNVRYVGDKNHNDLAGSPLRGHIGKAAITITANDEIGPDDPDVSALGYFITGDFVEADREALQIWLSLGKEEAGEDGPKVYPVMVSCRSDSNYDITKVNGKYTVIKDVSVVISDYNGVYDGEEHSISVEVKEGEASVYYSDTEITDAAALNQKIEEAGGIDNLPRISYRDAGVYTVYYAITGEGMFVSGSKTVVIIPKELVITAEAAGKIYGEADPVLTFTVSGEEDVLPVSEGTEGNESDDSFLPQVGAGGADQAVFTGALSREPGEDVGTYAVTLGSLSAGDNYRLKLVSVPFTISRKILTVTADAKTKITGEADPVLTYKADGLVRGDSLKGSLVREPGEDPGTYAITIGTLSAGNNYDLQFTGANLTVTDIPVVTPTVTPEPTPTETPEVTPTETPELTPTETPDVTPTETPEVTPTETPDVTPTETPEVTPTVTPEPTLTETPEVSPTLTPAPTSTIAPAAASGTGGSANNYEASKAPAGTGDDTAAMAYILLMLAATFMAGLIIFFMRRDRNKI